MHSTRHRNLNDLIKNHSSYYWEFTVVLTGREGDSGRFDGKCQDRLSNADLEFIAINLVNRMGSARNRKEETVKLMLSGLNIEASGYLDHYHTSTDDNNLTLQVTLTRRDMFDIRGLRYANAKS